MSRWILTSVLAATMFSSTIAAQESGFGLGIILGEPTGISAKQWLTKNTAVDWAAAWSFGKHDAWQVHADYLVHNSEIFSSKSDRWFLYYGLGGRIKFEKDSKISVRFPAGFYLIPSDAPVDIFMEIVPLLDMAPSTDFDLNAAIGARYFFEQRQPRRY